MAEAKKKLKKMTIRESHRTFLRKIIAEARESLKSGESVNVNKLKFFKSTLQDKTLELKSLDKGVLWYLHNLKVEDVSVSCDFASAIQKCIDELEMASKSDSDKGRSQESSMV